MSRGLVPVRSGTYRAVFASGAPRAALAQVLEALGRGEDPARAVVVKRSTTRHLVRLELSDGTAVYVKRYITRTPGAGLRSLLGRSRAAQEYRNLVRLRALGLPAVEPLCFAERRHWRWLRDAVLVTRVVPDALRLDEHFERLDAATRPAVIDELARLVRRLHDAGW